jgi:hypothetical protein
MSTEIIQIPWRCSSNRRFADSSEDNLAKFFLAGQAALAEVQNDTFFVDGAMLSLAAPSNARLA